MEMKPGALDFEMWESIKLNSAHAPHPMPKQNPVHHIQTLAPGIFLEKWVRLPTHPRIASIVTTDQQLSTQMENQSNLPN